MRIPPPTAALIALFVVLRLNAAPVIVNPSFEADTFSVFPGYVSGNGPITGWTSLENHGINPAAGSPFADNGTPPDGSQVAFMQGDGVMSQMISGFESGQTYQLEFFENARTVAAFPWLAVTIGGRAVVGQHVVQPVGGANPYVHVVSDNFEATAETLELKFLKYGPGGLDTTVLIDAVGFRTRRLKVVEGLFNTGVDQFGLALPDNTIDPHYRLIVNADSASSDLLVQDSTAFPISNGTWLWNHAGSKWIGPRFNTSQAAGLATGMGRYVYRTSVDLTGVDLPTVIITGAWAMDNNGLSLSVNGTPTGLTAAGFGALTPFRITSANATFVNGINTLDFEVENVDLVAGYTGLRIDNLRGFATLAGTPPLILIQPHGQDVGDGDVVTLTVAAEGSSPLMYQWKKDGEDLGGETGSSLVFDPVGEGDAGVYTVEVSNGAGSLLSTEATLVVFDVLPGLYSTGVDDLHTPLMDGAVDPHYRLVLNPNGGGSDAVVHNSQVFPIVTGPWLANSGTSKWIGPVIDTVASAGGDYAYRLSFVLDSFDPSIAPTIVGGWTSDNGGVDILLNGVSTGISQPGNFGALNPFTIGGLLIGPNTLEFRVNNSVAGHTGLRVEGLRILGAVSPPNALPVVEGALPSSQSKFIGETATFLVRANGSAPISYQWLHNGSPLTGETGPILTFEVISPLQAGDYTVEVSNSEGTQVSQPGNLAVSDAPGIITQPQDQWVAEGDTVTLSVEAIGEPPFGYQWWRNGVEIIGAEASILVLENVALADAGDYSVTVFNFGGAVQSDIAVVTVAEVIPGLFNTGVDMSGVPLAEGAVDPHWTLAASADPGFPGPDAIVIRDFDFPFPPWLPTDASSKWIAPRVSQNSRTGGGNAVGDYTYRTTIDLTGQDLANVRIEGEWATDNLGSDILVNGVSSGQVNTGQFITWTPFSLRNDLVDRVNTLDFIVNNQGPPGPTGFRVQNIRVLRLPPPFIVTELSLDVSGDTATISWNAEEGRAYRVQFKDELGDLRWTDLPGTVTAGGATASATDTSVGGVSQRFYRVCRL